ncbi:MAG: hypothetical protein ACOX3T_00560 [Bdellovibrionota bacterium]
MVEKSNLGNTTVNLKNDSATGSDNEDGSAAILSNLKWSKLQAIVGARITTPGLKDSFVEFMAGNCGGVIKQSIDDRKLINARRNPVSFLSDANSNDKKIGILKDADSLGTDLKKEFTTTQGSLKRLLNTCSKEESSTSDGTSLCQFLGNDIKPYTEAKFDVIGCDKSFKIIMKALKWETGQIYHKMMADWDNGDSSKEKEILVAFYYGWNLDKKNPTGISNRLSDDELKYFTRDLILSYMLRNELEFVPKITNVQYSTKVQAEQASDTHIQSLGSQNKFGEIYTWARMMPYIQGILMFILAGAYPIVCIIMIIPGAHKAILTWAAFWAWVKFWDLGFAIVTVIERSVWGMLGNSTHASAVNKTLVELISGSNATPNGISGIEVSCNGGQSFGSCAYPTISSEGSMFLSEMFDQGTAIGLSLNYGVYNGYYIYIMAALYMAVPVICGQVFLKGKYGVGSLVSTMMGGAERAGGGAAETSAKSRIAADISNTSAIADRQVKADAAKNYAMRAMEAGNKAAKEGLFAQHIGAANQGMELKKGMANLQSAQYRALAWQMQMTAQGFASHNLSPFPMGVREVMNAAALAGLWSNAAGHLPKSLLNNNQFPEQLGKFLGDTNIAEGLTEEVLSPLAGEWKDLQGFVNGFLEGDNVGAQQDEEGQNGQQKEEEKNAQQLGEVIFGASGSGVSIASSGVNTSRTGGEVRIGQGNQKVGPFDFDFLKFQKGIAWSLPFSNASYVYDFNVANPLSEGVLQAKADNNLFSFDSGAQQNLQKGFADRMDTMAKYAGDVAGYEMKQDLAMSNQHLAGVYGVNLMPQQKPYDIKGMMGSGEIVSSDGTSAKGMFDFFGTDSTVGSEYGNLTSGYIDKLQDNYARSQIGIGSFNNLPYSKVADHSTVQYYLYPSVGGALSYGDENNVANVKGTTAASTYGRGLGLLDEFRRGVVEGVNESQNQSNSSEQSQSTAPAINSSQVFSGQNQSEVPAANNNSQVSNGQSRSVVLAANDSSQVSSKQSQNEVPATNNSPVATRTNSSATTTKSDKEY